MAKHKQQYRPQEINRQGTEIAPDVIAHDPVMVDQKQVYVGDSGSDTGGISKQNHPEDSSLVAEKGWLPIASVPRNGLPVKLTDDPEKEGVVAFWRKSRAFANATHRWEETGFWTDSVTSQIIDFKPLWWKDRHS